MLLPLKDNHHYPAWLLFTNLRSFLRSQELDKILANSRRAAKRPFVGKHQKENWMRLKMFGWRSNGKDWTLPKKEAEQRIRGIRERITYETFEVEAENVANRLRKRQADSTVESRGTPRQRTDESVSEMVDNNNNANHDVPKISHLRLRSKSLVVEVDMNELKNLSKI